ncbi:hypothetical protein CEUSTIGMA_g3540.t1 [Chlamydomonas eustigma]|uniref:UGP3-like C-terminal hexapeptide repeats domain-containing protein n=1 Tax=Chlamydomonas eustigma TaxID=1157962 RepID=A0A250WZ30_9CHLO|nr:hypothetical protein CEUSTIGMA_g3540.t1 [Chlamydomonas eustigma]|eukprot:GAX76097.1 hypothetical protein CEUSTIGMA_g3540.t1 [Chlamydomonas eustigma]
MVSDKFATVMNSHNDTQRLRGFFRAGSEHHVHFALVRPKSRPLRCHAPRERILTESLKNYVETQQCSHISFDEEFQVTDESIHPIVREGRRLATLHRKVTALTTCAEKVAFLSELHMVREFLHNAENIAIQEALRSLPIQDQYLLLCLPASGQSHVLKIVKEGTPNYLMTALEKLLNTLRRVEAFYDSIGGVLGYQAKSLQLIAAGMEELREEQQAKHQGKVLCHDDPFAMSERRFHVPKAVDLAAEDGREVARLAAQAGLKSMPLMAEIYPVGGAGDRLGLLDEITGECLPAAMLPYCGRTMMEVLLRDLQAREYLYFKLTGQQLVTPVAIMTSEAKGNDTRMHQLMESQRWFGRGKDAFRLFRQPLVPVMNVENGKWLLSDQLHPMTKPGGHGAIWKLLKDEGVFSWLEHQGREAAIIRQISNPMAGVDTTLLALAGVGTSRRAAFGFMSCDRHVGAAEGVNVLQENKVWRDGRWQYEYGLTNIEYTEFDRLGITDQPVEGAHDAAQLSAFPANTNVLYVGLTAARDVVERAIATRSSDQLMPGLIFNLKKKVAYTDPLIEGSAAMQQKVQAGRMECTMQNLADYMVERFDSQMTSAEAAASKLSTFLVYNHRRKVTSSAKKKREPGSTKISQTPDGSFFDLQRNAWHLLQQCGVNSLPELGCVEQYLAQGPGFIFLFHPALGPLWDVISQKVMGGSLHQGSELVLEVAEASLEEVHVEGSLLVYAENVMGHMTGPITVHGLQYGEEGLQLHTGLPNQLALRHVSAQVPLMSSVEEEGSRPSLGGLLGQEMLSSTVPEVSAAEERLMYSSRCGRVHLSNVMIRNQGVDWVAPGNVYWKHQLKRHEAVRIVLQGGSEFEARDVVITGDHTFTVPDGHRMVLSQGSSGGLVTHLSPLRNSQPSWQWHYTMESDGSIRLDQKWAVSV